MNWFVQFLRDSNEMEQLVDDLEAFVVVVLFFVFMYWVLS
jgi:hypothetical protein